jgi:hypothetical protein
MTFSDLAGQLNISICTVSPGIESPGNAVVCEIGLDSREAVRAPAFAAYPVMHEEEAFRIVLILQGEQSCAVRSPERFPPPSSKKILLSARYEPTLGRAFLISSLAASIASAGEPAAPNRSHLRHDRTGRVRPIADTIRNNSTDIAGTDRSRLISGGMQRIFLFVEVMG